MNSNHVTQIKTHKNRKGEAVASPLFGAVKLLVNSQPSISEIRYRLEGKLCQLPLSESLTAAPPSANFALKADRIYFKGEVVKRLGIDIGTNSIGWALVDTAHQQVIALGSHIYSDGRDPTSKRSLAEKRTAARSMRRRRDRYLRRRSVLLEALIQFGMMPADADEARLVAARDPYDLRLRALDHALTPHEIGRALFHLNQRRGFKSNRKAERSRKDDEGGKVETAVKALDQAMAEIRARTLGEFLAQRSERRVRMGGESQAYDFYPLRAHVEAEFEAIWIAQKHHHLDLMTDEVRDRLHYIIFGQRDLKDQIVGYCTFAGWGDVLNDERRLPKAHPLFQTRRLYEEVNALRVVSPGAKDRALTLDQRDALILKLQSVRKASFSALGKLIRLQDGERFNKDTATRKDMLGDEVRAELSDKKRFGPFWSEFSLDQQWEIIQRLQNEPNPDALHAWLKIQFQLDDEAAVNIANAKLPEGYGRFGETASRLLIEALRGDVIVYSEAAAKAGLHHSDFRTGEAWEQLPYYGEILAREISPGKPEYGDEDERRFGKITNPTVHIGLRQTQKLINRLIAIHGRPDEIVVELARDLKLNDEQKKDHEKRIRRDTEAAKARGEKLEGEGISDTGANRMRMRIWEEMNPSNPLDRRCPYCAEMISIRQLFSDEVDIDHIIPYSQSLDDSIGNKVVAHRHCNRAKGNKTPFERWGSDDDRWEIISQQVARMHRSRQWRFGPEAREKMEKDGGFIARQLTDTQYLSRLTAQYMSCLYSPDEGRRVYAIPGRMTSMLRRQWGLNSLLPDHNFVENEHSNAPKNRLDHRHHAIDAVVAALTSVSLMQKIATVAGRAEAQELDHLLKGLEPPWPAFRDQLASKLTKVVASHKPDHGRKKRPSKNHDVTSGRLHNDTAYGFTGQMAADGKTPIVVHRVPLSSLKPADLENPQALPDTALRLAIVEATQGLAGKAYDQALARFQKEGARQKDKNGQPVFKGIRRVRMRKPLSVIAVRDENGRAYKGYKGDSNARYDVWCLPDGKWIADVVSTFDAHQSVQIDRRPHPAAKKVLSLRQNDLLAIQRDGGEREIVRVVKLSAGAIILAGGNEAGPLKTRNTTPNDIDPFKYINASATFLKNNRGRQIRMDELGRIFDPGPRT